MSYKKGLGFRMEDASMAAAVDGYDAEQSIDTDNEAAAAVGEAEMVEGPAVETFEAMDDSIDAAEELGTEVLPQLVEATEDEGLTPREAEGLQARIERICRKAGIDVNTTGLVMRREHFGGSTARKAQTKMRKEAAAGVFATIWENLKKAWAWLKDQVTNIWNKWTSNAEGIKKRLTDIQTRITALPAGAKPKDARLKTRARFFSVDRNVTPTTIADVVTSVKGLSASAAVLRKAIGQVTASTLKQEMGAGSGGDTGTIAQAFTTNIVDGVKGQIKEVRSRDKLTRNFRSDAEKSEVIAVLGAFPDGRSLVVEKQQVTAGTKTTQVAKISMAVVEDSFAEDYEAPKDKSSLQGLVTQGQDVINTLIKSTKDKAELEEAIKNVMDTCDSNAKQATAFADSDANTDKDDLRSSVQVRVAVLRAAQTIAKTLATDSPKMLFDTAAALADMAAAGVSNMKEDK